MIKTNKLPHLLRSMHEFDRKTMVLKVFQHYKGSYPNKKQIR